MNAAVGLDFGTSTTLVASVDGVVPIGRSSAWLPSLAGYGDDESIVVGEAALELPAEQLVRSVKRSITQRRSFVQLDTATGLRDIRTDELMVALLKETARRAGLAGQDLTGVGRVRLGCPAMWDGAQRRRLLEAARRAGLMVTLASFVDEPVAAGIAWLAGNPVDAGKPLRVLVFDMGGGTLDVAVLEVHGAGGHPDVTVLAALGVAEAGDALDDRIADDLDDTLAVQGIDVDSLLQPGRARAYLLDAAREAKVALTTATEHVVVLPPRVFGRGELWYTREQLNEVFAAQLDRAEACVAAALRAARLTQLESGSAYDIARAPVDELAEGVDVVVLSGGMSQVPYVAQRMREFFSPRTRIETATTPAEHAVAIGLAKASRYGRINMYRPAFDVLVEWDREFRLVYEAYTPLVEARQVARGGGDLRFLRTGRDLSLPRQGRARLRTISHSGEPVRATLGGGSLDGFPVALSETDFAFSISPTGRIRMTDADGTYDGHLDWHPGS